ncbi:hypothetical protein B0T21DRAFT_353770 [Apiosordaria backusii]|uniref:Uncharacterized protein n=1 Tax=Apiosordaria backusii TaxID=314023 RepID=A0AA40DFC5_9PEZI|nr:hypothetical protein B0T21DRAFT_353770 [Apiosordaria backusii]
MSRRSSSDSNPSLFQLDRPVWRDFDVGPVYWCEHLGNPRANRHDVNRAFEFIPAFVVETQMYNIPDHANQAGSRQYREPTVPGWHFFQNASRGLYPHEYHNMPRLPGVFDVIYHPPRQSREPECRDPSLLALPAGDFVMAVLMPQDLLPLHTLAQVRQDWRHWWY